MKAIHCNTKHIFKLKPDQLLLDGGGLILLLNLPRPWTLVYVPEKRSFPLEDFMCGVINKAEMFRGFFLAGPYYLAQMMLSSQSNAGHIIKFFLNQEWTRHRC